MNGRRARAKRKKQVADARETRRQRVDRRAEATIADVAPELKQAYRELQEELGKIAIEHRQELDAVRTEWAERRAAAWFAYRKRRDELVRQAAKAAA